MLSVDLLSALFCFLQMPFLSLLSVSLPPPSHTYFRCCSDPTTGPENRTTTRLYPRKSQLTSPSTLPLSSTTNATRQSTSENGSSSLTIILVTALPVTFVLVLTIALFCRKFIRSSQNDETDQSKKTEVETGSRFLDARRRLKNAFHQKPNAAIPAVILEASKTPPCPNSQRSRISLYWTDAGLALPAMTSSPNLQQHTPRQKRHSAISVNQRLSPIAGVRGDHRTTTDRKTSALSWLSPQLA